MPSNKAYGCIFCLTGKEAYVARSLQRMAPEVRAVVAQREKLRFHHGREQVERSVLMPGYVFFQAPEGFEPFRHFPVDAIRILTAGQHEWRLQGQDQAFAAWLFQRDGLLEISKAYQENDRVRIVSGPLKDLEGRIRRINRHNRRGQVQLDFDGKTFAVWLNFELVKPAGSAAPTDSGNP